MPSPSPLEIAIVEDEPATAEMLSEMMRLNGYTVRTYHGAQTAIFSFRQHRPDVVILDIMMPDISGLEVLRYIRRDNSLHTLPVIILSAKSSPEDIQEGLAAGADLYLTKPVTFSEIKAAVERVLSLRQQAPG